MKRAILENWEPKDVPAKDIKTMTIRLIPIAGGASDEVFRKCEDKLEPLIERALGASLTIVWLRGP